MSKKRQNAKYRHYFVGQVGNEGHRFSAREPREAVRLWCEYQGHDFWEDHVSQITVWTDDCVEPWSRFQRRWIVDASQPPAWIIKPDPENSNGKKS